MITSELAGGSPDVLVVDDDPDIRQAVGDLLAEAGRFAMFADNGAQALRYAGIWNPRLILLDMRMPVLDGRGFLHRRLFDEKLARIPVLILSSEPLEQGLLDEVTGWISKPVDGDRLVELVAHLLDDERPPAPAVRGAGGSGERW